jgi:hypothetical protein
MFVLCPHCQFLVALNPASGQPPKRCPRCDEPLQPATPAAANAAAAHVEPGPAAVPPTEAAAASASDAGTAQARKPAPAPTSAPVSTSAPAPAPKAKPRTRSKPVPASKPGDIDPPAATASAAEASIQPEAGMAAPADVEKQKTTPPADIEVDVEPGPRAEAAIEAPVDANQEPAAMASAAAPARTTAPDAGAAAAVPAPETTPALLPKTAPRPAETLPAPAAPLPRPAPRGKATPSFVRTPVAATGIDSRRNWRTPAAIVALVLLLSLQLLLADRAQLAASARWRPLVSALCGALQCSVPAWHEPGAFTLLHRDVRPHPTLPGVLHVSATFRNDARWPQPWPALLLTLSDIDGRSVGARAFAPRDYLGDTPTRSGLASGQSATVAMDIVEPAPRIVAFTFDFH